MPALNYTFSYMDNSMQRRHLLIERRPRTLKDFLVDESISCSSSGFKSFPRSGSHCTLRSILECDGGERESNPNSERRILRSRSTAAAEATISAFQKASEIVINAVKSPSFLQRSLKRRFWRRRNRTAERGVAVTVTRVKDIVRMRSFREATDEKSPPSDSPDSTATTSSYGSSWCESDGKSEEYSGDCGAKLREKYVLGVGDGDADTTIMTTTSNGELGSTKEELRCDEEKQQSPVSALDFPFTEDAELPFSFLTREEEAEERAMQLLDQMKAASSVDFDETNLNYDLLLQFFKDEMVKMSRRNQRDGGKEVVGEILMTAEAWLSGELEWGVETEKAGCVKDMEREGRWRKFEEEEEEMALLLEVLLFEILVDELLGDFYVKSDT